MDKNLHATLTTWRRHLHAHPEPTLEERETAAFVAARLTELGIPHVTGVGGNGVVATISRGASNRSVGLRADMDALPILEQTGLAYASTRPGAMHACGHDGHTVSLLGAAALLARDPSWSGTVQLVFQPAEEGGGGARAMLDAGLLDRFPMERIFAYHNWPGLEAGTIAVHDAAVMAGGTRVDITIEGHAGHAAMPHLARDPMVAAGHLLVALQTIVARNVDPMKSAVVSMCTVEAGKAANQIPSHVVLRGTARFFDNETRDLLDEAIHRVAAGVAATYGVRAEVKVPWGLGPTVNHKAEADLAATACTAAGLAVTRSLPPAMTGEDFAHFLRARPGAFLWIGNGPADAGHELHNDHYDFNDAILPAASGALAAIAKRALGD